LLLSRQALPFATRESTNGVRRGAYVLSDTPLGAGALIATGSEVPLALAAQKILGDDGVAVRVVSMPSTNVFDRQDAAYRDSVLPRGMPRVAVEAGVTDFWRKYVGLEGAVVGIDRLRRIGARGRCIQVLRLYAGECSQGSKERFDMTIKVAINGFGRIGRNILRAHYEDGKKHDLQFVAINDLGDAQINAHLLTYDTAHGRFNGSVGVDGDSLVVNGDRIKVLAERDPAKLPWKSLGVDAVLECTGLFTSKAKAGAHLAAGAKKVVISAPGEKDVDRTVVFGVNHATLKASDSVISNASCTTNCLAPLVKALDDGIGVVSGLMTTVHSYTNDQVLTDVYHKDLRRARSASQNMIPTKTGAAGRGRAGAAAPQRQARRVLDPRADDQRLDRRPFLSSRSGRPASKKSTRCCSRLPQAISRGILEYTTEQLVSSDFNHNPASSIVDALLTKVAEERWSRWPRGTTTSGASPTACSTSRSR
jgi:glyceraldehyde 3-phosphate dehydrogenase